MNTKIKLNKREYRVMLITLIIGLLLGWVFFHGSGNKHETELSAEEHVHEESTIWTCSMHPQVRLDHAGKCPICGMDLVPIVENGGSDNQSSADEIQMTEAAMKIADIQTMVVREAYPEKEVYLLGKVKPDERNISELTARFGGRIEKLYVNFTGQNVKKGEKLATIYSPALVTAQRELLEALEYQQSNPDLYVAARNKLKLWDLTDEQINQIEQKGVAQSYFDVLSPIAGTVTERNVALGDYVKEGNALFRVINLNTVWVMFEAYESDLPWIKTGDRTDFIVQSLPGKNFTGRVSFIDPLIDPKTRIAQVRVEVQNPGLLLKPEMFANGTVTSTIAGNRKDLLIPKTAVLWTGKRAVVYVKFPEREQPAFSYREITLGPSAGAFYVVDDGLTEGEEIAVHGVFKIDAAAQLAGKSSMMNPDGSAGVAVHNHGSMTMDEGSTVQNAVYITNETSTTDNADRNTGKQVVDPLFKDQLTAVYKIYLPMKDAFVQSDATEVAQQAQKVNSQLEAVDMELLSGEIHMKWMAELKVLRENLEKMSQSSDIQDQRSAFAQFNAAFYQAVKDFGLDGITSYYQYCPMAENNQGAYWLSDIKDIRNPYFGEAMMTCGETKETLRF